MRQPAPPGRPSDPSAAGGPRALLPQDESRRRYRSQSRPLHPLMSARTPLLALCRGDCGDIVPGLGIGHPTRVGTGSHDAGRLRQVAPISPRLASRVTDMVRGVAACTGAGGPWTPPRVRYVRNDAFAETRSGRPVRPPAPDQLFGSIRDLRGIPRPRKGVDVPMGLGRTYFAVPNCRSPASPSPGMM